MLGHSMQPVTTESPPSGTNAKPGSSIKPTNKGTVARTAIMAFLVVCIFFTGRLSTVTTSSGTSSSSSSSTPTALLMNSSDESILRDTVNSSSDRKDFSPVVDKKNVTVRMVAPTSKKYAVSWEKNVNRYIPPKTRGVRVVLDPRQITGFPPNLSERGTSDRDLVMATLLLSSVDLRKRQATLQRFFASLRWTGCNASVIVFVNSDIVEDIRQLAAPYNAYIVGFNKTRAIRKNAFWVSSLRFLLYRLALQKLPNVQMVMACDFFDVYFGVDPFVTARQQLTRGKTMLLSVERTLITPKGPKAMDYGCNYNWLNRCYKKQIAKTLIGKHSYNSGATIGLMPTFFKYVRAMDVAMRSNPDCSFTGADQGVHNYIMRKFFPNSLSKESTISTGVMLTGHAVKDWLIEPGTGRFLNQDGYPYLTVHQSNRCGRLGGASWPARFWTLVKISDLTPSEMKELLEDLDYSNEAPVGRYVTSAEKKLEKRTVFRFKPKGRVFRRLPNATCDDVMWPSYLRHLRPADATPGSTGQDEFEELATEMEHFEAERSGAIWGADSEAMAVPNSDRDERKEVEVTTRNAHLDRIQGALAGRGNTKETGEE